MQLRQLTSLVNQPAARGFLQEAPFWAENGPKSEAFYRHWLNLPRNWWLAEDRSGWQFLSALEKLEFDSQLFGHPMGWLNPFIHRAAWPDADSLASGAAYVEQMRLEARGQDLRFLQARVNSRDMLGAQCLETAGFRLMDISVEWQLDLNRLPVLTPRPGYYVTSWQEAERGALMALAGSAFSDLNAYGDRFTLDPGLRHGSGRLYETWLANSLSGQQADQVLTLKAADKCVGFISMRLPRPGADSGWVVLNALNADMRGQGLYNYMLLHALYWLKEQNSKFARIRTKVSQTAVINTWSALGARQVWADMTFHWWDSERR